MADERAGLKTLSFSEALAIARSLGKLTTGSRGMDSMIGGGYEEARITEVFGPSNSGKTQLAIQATLMAAAAGWTSVFVDTESTFRPERLEEMATARGVDPRAALDSVFCIRARDVKAQTGALKRMGESPAVQAAKLVVVDTVTKNFTLEFPGKEGTGRRQGALGSYLNRMAVDAYLHRRVVLLTNRVASVTRDGVTRDVNLGGITLSRFVSKSVRLRREGHSVLANVESPPNAAQPIRCELSGRGFE